MTFTANPDQRRVIEAAAGMRLVVDGGPGTGKTATAAARAIALCEDGVAAERLWLISFTRAAVEEMRRRLTQLSSCTPLPRVTTLDSFAWSLRDGELDAERPVVENYDAAIAETLSRLRRGDAHISGRLGAIDHLIIDETQDLVGDRALLVIALAEALPPATGLTILTDEAQAIYGFAQRGLSASFTAETVAQHFLERPIAKDGASFVLHHLSLLHRTDNRKLIRLFVLARRQALATGNPHRKLARLRRRVGWYRLGTKKSHADLILYRSRAEVLYTGGAWARRGMPHRLRLSGLPVLPQRWLALLLHDYEYNTLSQEAFFQLWRERIGPGGEPAAWDSLAGAKDTISLREVRKQLCEAEPPPALCRFDPGAEAAPVIGTIHASKGREAEHVRLMLPHNHGGKNDPDPDGEARVLFVGATRAKSTLQIGTGLKLKARRLKSGRVYLAGLPGEKSAAVEIGRPGDFDWSSAAAHHGLLTGTLHGTSISLRFCHNRLEAYLGDQSIGVASPALLSDLRQIRGLVSAPYEAFNPGCGDAYLLDLGTLVAENKFYLAPIIAGLPRIEF